jgi:hypothetical protein
VAIYYGSGTAYPTGAFGEAIPQNNAATNSPDAVGDRAAYFVSDLATNQSLSQWITVTDAGIYQIGFSAYAPANGYANIYDATFTGIIATVQLANYAVSTEIAKTWKSFTGAANLVADDYLVEFVFDTGGVPAKDVVIDQVYVIAGNPSVDVPEPGSLALLVWASPVWPLSRDASKNKSKPDRSPGRLVQKRVAMPPFFYLPLPFKRFGAAATRPQQSAALLVPMRAD